MIDKSDLKYLEAHGISGYNVSLQLQSLLGEKDFLQVIKPATVGNGIIQLKPTEQEQLLNDFKAREADLNICFFIPASGAATRMFKNLKMIVDKCEKDPSPEEFSAFVVNKKLEKTIHALDHIDSLPFSQLIQEQKENLAGETNLSSSEKYYELSKYILGPDGLNYEYKPKALIPFIKTDNGQITALTGHIKHAFSHYQYCENVDLHFTINKYHEPQFYHTMEELIFEDISINTDKMFITFSYQNPATAAVCIDEDKNIVRDEEGNVLMRPSGHGALVQNLQMVNSDIILIKNIDNLKRDEQTEQVARSEKILIAYLNKLKDQLFTYQQLIKNANRLPEEVSEIYTFLEEQLNYNFPKIFFDAEDEDKINLLKHILFRPIRACYMVPNKGQKGGGPFYVQDKMVESIQIIEQAEMNMDDPAVKKIVDKSTHFNPVVIAACIKDYEGHKLKLDEFSLPERIILNEKFQNGKTIRTYELPGLWNGSMHKWHTVFLEAPDEIFFPVKSMVDLLERE